jgi:PAS domain S-box-containing protein
MATTNFNSEFRGFLFHSNPVPMFLYDATSLRILRANQAALARYGYTAREFRSMTIRELCPYGEDHTLGSALHADHETPAQPLWTHSTRDGKLFAVEIRLSPLLHRQRHFCLMSAIDASTWSEARLKLMRSEETHRSLVHNCPFGIYRIHLDTLRLEWANPALLHAIGYSCEELFSIDISSLYVNPADRAHFLRELRASGSVNDFEVRFRQKDGGILRVSMSGYLYANAETSQRYIQGYILDITRQRELEEQLSHIHRMETVGRLAGGVAHDFNNITQSISLSCELALSHQLAPSIESKLLDIMQQSARAAEITRQLLAFSRLQVLQPRVVNLNNTVRNALSMLTRAVGVDVSIELNLDETVDHILIDPEQLTLVLMQLANNARDAMPQGGRLQISTASCPAGPAPIKGMNSKPCALLTVSDTGTGIDEQTLSHIFEPFFSTKDTTLTTGLGLSTVHGIVAQSKGLIECQSSPGQGATFRIFLPLATEHPAAVFTGDNNGCRVLLAEDDPVVNKHLTSALEKAGFSVDSACNGEEALAAFARQPYHVVVTDIIMPKLGGIELTKRLRQQNPVVPVILISGYCDEIRVLQLLPRTHIAYLQKPFATPQLVAIIRNFLARPNLDSQKPNADASASPIPSPPSS